MQDKSPPDHFDAAIEAMNDASKWRQEQQEKREAEEKARRPGPVLTKLSSIEAQEISWLWPGRIAAGKLNILAGDPGLGKSFVSLDIIARITTGRLWPDGGKPADIGSVILLSAEDDPADTIRPRMDALGANVNLVTILECVRVGPDRERSFNLAKDLFHLEKAISEVQPRLVVIDPVSAYLAGIDSHKNTDVRAVLGPVSALGSKTKTGILAITHLSKGEGEPLNRLSGSIAFGAAARGVWLIAKDPQNHQRRLMLSVKSNLSREAKGLAFQISENEHGRAVVAWERDPVEITVAEVLGQVREHRAKRPAEKIREACDLLRRILVDGPKPTKDVNAAGVSQGITEHTLERARKLLGVKARKRAFDGEWVLEFSEVRQVAQSPSPGSVAGDRQTYTERTTSAKSANPDVGVDREEGRAADQGSKLPEHEDRQNEDWRRSSKPNAEKDFNEDRQNPGRDGGPPLSPDREVF